MFPVENRYYNTCSQGCNTPSEYRPSLCVNRFHSGYLRSRRQIFFLLRQFSSALHRSIWSLAIRSIRRLATISIRHLATISIRHLATSSIRCLITSHLANSTGAFRRITAKVASAACFTSGMHATPVHISAEHAALRVAIRSGYFFDRNLFCIVSDHNLITLADLHLRAADQCRCKGKGNVPRH